MTVNATNINPSQLLDELKDNGIIGVTITVDVSPYSNNAYKLAAPPGTILVSIFWRCFSDAER